MAWPKIKNIIILMLLVTNLCLLAFGAGGRSGTGSSRTRRWSRPSPFPGGAGHPGGRGASCPGLHCRPWAWNGTWRKSSTLAAALLGDGLTREERSGEVYVYGGERGLLQCHSSGEFWADFQSGAFPVPERGRRWQHALGTMERSTSRGGW